MRGFLILSLICLLVAPLPADAAFGIFKKKDYKQIFLNDAYRAEKRNDDKSAFHSYEKAVYYYPKDQKVIASYAGFCERQKYFEKAENLYQKLYLMTKDNKYLFKKNLCRIKNGKVSDAELKDIFKTEGITSGQKNQMNSALIFHYLFKGNWAGVKKACDSLSKNALTAENITTCIAASEKAADKKNILEYYLRYSELYPKDSEIINKIIILGEKVNNYDIQETFIKKLTTLNPNDNGIKYRLAGFYEKHKEWQKAATVYEGLMASGDSSGHVKNSLAYVESQLHPKKGVSFKEYAPKPLSGFKLQEKLFYESLDAKSYPKALSYLNKMLKTEPNNTKLLKHKVDIEFAQNNYDEAIKYLEKIQEIKPLSFEDEKFLAFLYSKIDKPDKSAKALEISEGLVQKYPDSKEAIKLALDYAMAQKNWDKAIIYADKLLTLEPNSENTLKTLGDLYSAKKDFPTAISFYEKLVQYHTKPDYMFELSNLYMANQDFASAEGMLQPLFAANPDNTKYMESYLNSILAQKKLIQAYWFIKANHLENTRDGFMVFGDVAMKNKDYYTANYDYRRALEYDPENSVLQNKLAEAYRALGYYNTADMLFKRVLTKDSENLEARLGLGSLQTDKKNPKTARAIFAGILGEKPDYRPAKVAVANSYIAEDEKIMAIETLEHIDEDEETQVMESQAYYDMNMWSDSKEALKGNVSNDAEVLKYKIKREEAFILTPVYTLFAQQLSDEFNLDYQKYGFMLSQKTNWNLNVSAEYNVFWYSSGARRYLNNVVNEFKGGIQARPNQKWEYKANFGVKAFEFGDGAMLLTDSWIKHYFSDKFNLKAGIWRNNLEQSYLSAVGQYVNGIFTGRVAETKFYLEPEWKLPNRFYAFGRGAFGYMYSQNLPTNPYYEWMLGVGRPFYENKRNPWLQLMSADIVSYNSSYKYNLLNIYDSAGILFGGYFSPAFFTANTLQLKMEGEIKNIKWFRVKYGLKGFGGVQQAITQDFTRPTWGYSPYITYDINDNIAIVASYAHYNFADITRDIFTINAVIRGFRKNAKN